MRIVAALIFSNFVLFIVFASGLSWAQTTDTIATVNNADMIRMQELSEDFTRENPDIRLNWITLEENVLRQRVTTDIATNGGQYDVLTIGNYEVPIWAGRDWLVPDDLIFAAPSDDTNAHGGAGADRIFFQYDYFDNGPLPGVGVGLNVELDGGRDDDEILLEVHSSVDGAFAAYGGSGRDRIEIVYRFNPGASTSSAQDINADGLGDSDVLVFGPGSANTGMPVVGNYRFNGGDGDDQFFIDLRGLGGVP